MVASTCVVLDAKKFIESGSPDKLKKAINVLEDRIGAYRQLVRWPLLEQSLQMDLDECFVRLRKIEAERGLPSAASVLTYRRKVEHMR